MKVYCVMERKKDGRVRVLSAKKSENRASIEVAYYRSLEEESYDDEKQFHSYWYQEVEVED